VRLAHDRRFAGDEELRMRIAMHPHLPAPELTPLIGSLPAATLRRLLARPALPPPVRSAIVMKLHGSH